eukprot:TRINITY_DN8766_c0_g3_i2.p1 TRINITY_DN8766_c0_g3~~TRINITY_DN8766_c0_g3_i2.p1  ORF type:complete len:157 (-),score=53.82 TRINITY_DN8766_c0_g3_i2:379-849(-)
MRLQVSDEELTSEQIDVFTEAFKMFDKDGSGRVDVHEFREVFESLGMDPTDSEMQMMLMDVDKDGSGDIDIDEFLSAMKSKYRDTEAAELIENAFDVFDTDGSGSLSCQEMEDILKNMGDHMEMPMIRRLVAAADSNKNGTVELDEFMAMVLGRLI